MCVLSINTSCTSNKGLLLPDGISKCGAYWPETHSVYRIMFHIFLSKLDLNFVDQKSILPLVYTSPFFFRGSS